MSDQNNTMSPRRVGSDGVLGDVVSRDSAKDPLLMMTPNQMRHVAQIMCSCDECLGTPVIAVFHDKIKVGCRACNLFAKGHDLTTALTEWNASRGADTWRESPNGQSAGTAD